MTNLSTLVQQLKSERENLQRQLDALNAAINALGSNAIGQLGRRRARTMSAAARARIAAAQRARWAKWKKAKKAAA